MLMSLQFLPNTRLRAPTIAIKSPLYFLSQTFGPWYGGRVQNVWGRKTYQRTRSPENFWTPPTELLFCSVLDFCTVKTEHWHLRGVENVPYEGGGVQNPFLGGVSFVRVSTPLFFPPPHGVLWNVPVASQTAMGKFYLSSEIAKTICLGPKDSLPFFFQRLTAIFHLRQRITVAIVEKSQCTQVPGASQPLLTPNTSAKASQYRWEVDIIHIGGICTTSSQKAYFCLQMGGVTQHFAKVSGSGVDVHDSAEDRFSPEIVVSVVCPTFRLKC